MSDKKEKKPKITKDMVPEGFTLSLAIVDAIPVLLFAAAIVILGIKANFSPLIMLGGFIIFLAGAIKVLWKVIVATKQKNVFWMYKQMGPAMGVGFLLLIIGCIVSRAALEARLVGPEIQLDRTVYQRRWRALPLPRAGTAVIKGEK